jgi:hypothetical protein
LRKHYKLPAVTAPLVLVALAMADSVQPTPSEGTPVAGVEMGDEVVAVAHVGEDEAGLTELEPEMPRLVLFAE